MKSVQAVVAAHKERHPEHYCPARKCLWYLSGGPCPKHTRVPDEDPAYLDREEQRLAVYGERW